MVALFWAAKMLYSYSALTLREGMKMAKVLIIALIAALIIIIVGGYFAYTYFANQNPLNTQPTALSVEQIRDKAMIYLATNYVETVNLMNDLSWSGGRMDTGLLGSDLNLYDSGSWSMSIQNPVVADPIYTISANYSSGDVAVEWTGTSQDGSITQTSVNINYPSMTYMQMNNEAGGQDTILLLTQEQIRDFTMSYIKLCYNQTAPYMENLMWTGGQVNMGMMVGSTKYSYESSGWNLTMQSPVVPNPIYSVNATYASMGMNQNVEIIWQGTMQNSTITQTTYTFKP